LVVVIVKYQIRINHTIQSDLTMTSIHLVVKHLISGVKSRRDMTNFDACWVVVPFIHGYFLAKYITGTSGLKC